MRISFVEIYKEEVYDLLETETSQNGPRRKLRVVNCGNNMVS